MFQSVVVRQVATSEAPVKPQPPLRESFVRRSLSLKLLRGNLVIITGQSCFWWTFRIFFIFSARGRGKEESEVPGGGGVHFLLKIPGGGGGFPGGAEGPGGCLRRTGEFGGGGLNIFFGAETSAKLLWT